MSTVTQVAKTMQALLNEPANRLARETGFVQRQSELGGAEFAQALVFGWLANPDATLEELSQTAIAIGACVTPQAVHKRFTPQAAAFMEQLLKEGVQQVITAAPLAQPILRRFNGVYLTDSSVVTLPDVLAEVWPGCGGSTPEGTSAAVKLQVRIDFSSGSLQGPLLQAGRTHDQNSPLPTSPLPDGALHLADLGYFRLDTLRDYDQQRVYWLVRPKVNTVIYDQHGQPTTLAQLLAAQSGSQVDLAIQLGASHRIGCRLLAVRVPSAIAQKRRRQLRARAKKKGQTVSQARLQLADWGYYITNVPADLLTIQEAMTVAGVRWQIELLFKLWKSEGKLDKSRSSKPWRILCEFYAKLLALLIQHWIFLVSCWTYPDRSLHKAAQTVRKQAFHLAVVFSNTRQLCQALALIQHCLAVGCRLDKRRKQPATFQRLMCLSFES